MITRNNISSVTSTSSVTSMRKIEKFEDRLNQNEQSNRALLEELMRLQVSSRCSLSMNGKETKSPSICFTIRVSL